MLIKSSKSKNSSLSSSYSSSSSTSTEPIKLSPDLEKQLKANAEKSLRMGNVAQAKKFFESLINKKALQFDINGVYMARLFVQIAGIFKDYHKYEPALDYYKDALDIFQKLFKCEEEMLICCSDVALICHNQGKGAEALKYYQMVLELGKFLNHKEIDYCIVYSNCGDILLDQKETNKALLNYQKVIELHENRKVADETYVHCLNQLGLIYSTLKKNEVTRALTLLENSKKLAARLSRENLELGRCLSILGRIYVRLNDYNQALENLKRAEIILGKILDESHHERGVIFGAIAQILHQGKKYSESIEYRQKQIKIDFKRFGKGCSQLIEGYTQLGLTQYSQKKHYDALESFKAALTQCQASSAPDLFVVADIKNNIGMVQIELAHLQKAFDLYKSTLDSYPTQFNMDPDALSFKCYVELKLNFALVLKKQGQPKQALEQLEQALLTTTQAKGSNDLKCAEIHQLISKIHQGNEEFQLALNEAERAKTIYKIRLGRDSEELGSIRFMIGEILLQKGEEEAAATELLKALNTMKRVKNVKKLEQCEFEDLEAMSKKTAEVLARLQKGNKGVNVSTKLVENTVRSRGIKHSETYHLIKLLEELFPMAGYLPSDMEYLRLSTRTNNYYEVKEI